MIRCIKLCNVGIFDNSSKFQGFRRIILIYAENTCGKTTLAEVLRSLEINDPSIITKKQSFGSQQKPRVILECDDSSTIFQDGKWTDKQPLVKVFNESFVTNNVYSGHDIEPKHRQNLHNFALGNIGVSLSRNREELAQDIERYNKDMKEAKNVISESLRGGMDMDEFCELEKVQDIESEIRNAQTAHDDTLNADIIRNTDTFEKINLPTFDGPAIGAILQQSLADLNTKAASNITKHIASLGNGGEDWIAKGVEYMHEDNQTCPFCGQATADVSLIKHYQDYFSKEYTKLKRDITAMLDSIHEIHSRDAQTAFERTIGNNKKVEGVWAKHKLQMPDVDTELIVNEWIHVLKKIKELLDAKQASPLESIVLDNDILKSYECYCRQIAEINTKLEHNNEEINQIKSTVSNDIQSAFAKLSLLRTTKERYLPNTISWCDKYIQAKNNKDIAEEKKQRVTEQLEKYRNDIFPELQEEVNRYLECFGVRYTVQDFVPNNIRSGSSCSYKVRVEDMSIDARESKSKDDITIGNTLSTSERNTLALALFFSSLAKDRNLANTIVVVDDPVSSFDDSRTLATIQALRDLAEKTNQMIILSHNSTFLYRLWRKINHKDCLPLSIVHKNKGSTICNWNVAQVLNSEQIQRRSLLEKYVKYKEGDPKTVACAIRPYLEAVLETIYPSHYNAGMQNKDFFAKCKEKYDTSDQILDIETVNELHDIIDYTNPFMHGANQGTGQNPNSDELLNYTKRALNITNISTDKSHHS